MKKSNSTFDQLAQMPKFKPFAKYLAIGGAVCTLIGLVVKLSGSSIGQTLFTTGMGILAIVSLMFPYLLPFSKADENEANNTKLSQIWQFTMYLIGYGIAIVIIGVLFRVNHWPGGSMMLIVGCPSIAIGIAIWAIYLRPRYKTR